MFKVVRHHKTETVRIGFPQASSTSRRSSLVLNRIASYTRNSIKSSHMFCCWSFKRHFVSLPLNFVTISFNFDFIWRPRNYKINRSGSVSDRAAAGYILQRCLPIMARYCSCCRRSRLMSCFLNYINCHGYLCNSCKFTDQVQLPNKKWGQLICRF